MYNTIYPGYIGKYGNLNNNKPAVKKDEEKNPQSSRNAETTQYGTGDNTPSNSYFPNGEKVAIDYSKRQINIEQVLKDFQNTANAIGAPDNIKSEVGQYLKLVENQAVKDNPNQQIVQSNLRNASQILDEYITNTLKKPSKVVENWVDALFMQKIDYKMQPTEKPQEIIEEPNEKEIISQTEQVSEKQENEQVVQNGNIYVPSDTNLKRMFIQAKKYSAINEKEKALYSFQTAMDYAKEIGDEQTCAMIHYEEGKLFDDFNQISEALYNYNQAAEQSSDNNIKARAHVSMAKIYDDFVKLDTAVNHYFAAVSFAGEADNLPLQAKALADLGQIHAEKYDKQNSLMFMSFADTIADETNNNKVKSVISAKNATGCEILNEKKRALKYYGDSAMACTKTDDKLNLAKSYKNASELMLEYGNSAKAKKLMAKAYIAAQSTNNSAIKKEISAKLAKLQNS